MQLVSAPPNTGEENVVSLFYTLYRQTDVSFGPRTPNQEILRFS